MHDPELHGNDEALKLDVVVMRSEPRKVWFDFPNI
jgi:hypothetical protein